MSHTPDHHHTTRKLKYYPPQEPNYVLDPDNIERVFDERMRTFGQLYNMEYPADPVFDRR